MNDNYSQWFCKQTITKTLNDLKFSEIFFISQKFNYVHVTYSFDELLIFFWLTPPEIFFI